MTESTLEFQTSDAQLLRQRAFLLHQVAAAGGKLGKSEANKQLTKAVQEELTFTKSAANDARAKLRGHGYLEELKDGRVITFALTDKGRGELGSLAKYVPLLPAKGKYVAPVNDRERDMRLAFLLQQLADQPHGKLTKAGAEGRKELKPPTVLKLNAATARRIRGELVVAGEMDVERGDGTETYSLTDAGRARLRELRVAVPVLPPAGIVAIAPTDTVQQGRDAFVLLQLLRNDDNSATVVEVMAESHPKPLKMNHATAWQVREGLMAKGFMTVAAHGDRAKYTITPTGLAHLAELSFEALPEWKISASALTKLLRQTNIETRPAVSTAVDTPASAMLEQAVLEVFERLLRERHAVTKLVPLHEIRAEIRQKHGESAASHAVFDEVIRGLRRSHTMGFVGLADRSKATPSQIQDSVELGGQFLFYMEIPDAAISG